MNLPTRQWVKEISLLSFVYLIAFMLADIVGGFFVVLASAGNSSSEVPGLFYEGSIFGFCVISLVLIGAIVVPGKIFWLMVRRNKAASGSVNIQEIPIQIILLNLLFLSYGALISFFFVMESIGSAQSH